MERRGPPPPVSLAKGRPLNGQSRGQLRLTRTSYAECPPDKQGAARSMVRSRTRIPLLFPHGGCLAFGYAGGAFFHEKDFHCGEDDFDIFDQAGSGYIALVNVFWTQNLKN